MNRFSIAVAPVFFGLTTVLTMALALVGNAASSGVLTSAVETKRQSSLPSVIVRGNPANRTVALTFDDGPHGAKTAELLDLLHHLKVTATFFVVGQMVDRDPLTTLRIVREGHEIANHTYSHRRLPTLSHAESESEFREGARAISRATGQQPRLMRPPGGEYDDRTLAMARRTGQTVVLWTTDPGDFALPGTDTIVKRVKSKMVNGGIVLLHDGIDQTLQALPAIVEAYRSQGFRFVTVSEMAREPGAITSRGPHVVPGMLPKDYYRAYGNAPVTTQTDSIQKARDIAGT